MALPALHLPPLNAAKPTELGPLKPIDHLYIDTTFCTTDYAKMFPCRREVIKTAVDEITKYFKESKQSNENWIFIKFAGILLLQEKCPNFCELIMCIFVCSQIRPRIHAD